MLGKNIIVFDLETQRSFDEVGGRNCMEKLGISVLGAYFYRTDEYLVFEESELNNFEEMLADRPLLVGFNSRRFDCTVLQPYVRADLSKFPQLDILEEVVRVVSHRVKLESVAQATLGTGKSGSGLDALKYWKNGEIDKLKHYCLDDVKITREIYEYGANKGEILFMHKYGRGKARVPVTWEIEDPVGDAQDKQMGLF